MSKRKQPAWLFWIEAVAAVFGLIVVANEALAVFIDDQSPLAPIIKNFSFFSDPAVCDPNVLTLEELDLCLSRGGVEPH